MFLKHEHSQNNVETTFNRKDVCRKRSNIVISLNIIEHYAAIFLSSLKCFSAVLCILRRIKRETPQFAQRFRGQIRLPCIAFLGAP